LHRGKTTEEEKKSLEKVFIPALGACGMKVPKLIFPHPSVLFFSPKFIFWLRRANLVMINLQDEWKSPGVSTLIIHGLLFFAPCGSPATRCLGGFTTDVGDYCDCNMNGR
jgi:hypothetical protein